MDLPRWTRIAVLLLPLGAFTFAATILMRGHWLSPDDPAWSEWVLGTGFRAYAWATSSGTVWAAFGVLGVYLWLRETGPDGEWRPFWGLLLSLNGALTLMPALGMMAMEWPFLAERGAAGAAGDTTQSLLWMLWLGWSAVTYALGSIFLAQAIGARGHYLPAILYAAGAVLAGIPFWFWLEVAGTFVWAAGCALIAWAAWRSPRPAMPRMPEP